MIQSYQLLCQCFCHTAALPVFLPHSCSVSVSATQLLCQCFVDRYLNTSALRPRNLRGLETRGPPGALSRDEGANYGTPRVCKINPRGADPVSLFRAWPWVQHCCKLQDIFEANTTITSDGNLWTRRAVGLATLLTERTEHTSTTHL